MCWLHYSGSLKKGEPFFTKEMNVQLKFRQKESNVERLRYGLQSKQTAKGRVIIRPTVVFTEIQRLPDLYLEVVFLKKISCQWSKVEFLLWSQKWHVSWVCWEGKHAWSARSAIWGYSWLREPRCQQPMSTIRESSKNLLIISLCYFYLSPVMGNVEKFTMHFMY